MRSDKIKVDIVIRQNGVKLAKGKSMSITQAIDKINHTASKKIQGAVNAPLFAGIVTSIACFGLFYQVIVTIG